RHFVSEHLTNVLAHARRSVLWIGQQQRLAIENRRGILHRSRSKVGYADHIQFLEGILHRVILVVVTKDGLSSFERKPGLALLVWSRADANRDVVGGSRFANEISDGQRDEISRHLGRRVKRHGVLTRSGSWSVADQGPVRDRVVPLIDSGRQPKRRFVG